MHCTHEFGAFYRPDSELLILGSFPSVKSREEAFYYAHPQNRFWRVLAACFGETVPLTLLEKQDLLIRNRVALWDVIESCDIEGSSDASIRNAVPTDICALISNAPIRRVVLNGKTAERLFMRHHKDFPLPTVTMPSTSPANAAWSLERLTGEWKRAVCEKNL